MHRHLLILLLATATPAAADRFGTDGNQFEMAFTPIGNPGNPAKSGPTGTPGNGLGAVDHVFRMGVNEVSRGMIIAYNETGDGPEISMASLESLGGNGPNRPATGVSWNEAARFVNWLNTSSGHSPAYNFTTAGSNDNISRWAVGESGFDPSNPFRNTNAFYYLPTTDEWYKAAYYDPDAPGGGTYRGFTTGDADPTPVAGGTDAGSMVYRQSFGTGPADITNAGGLSAYGTMAQNGNVTEWTESGTINSSGEIDSREFLGGAWSTNLSVMGSQPRLATAPSNDFFSRGFRVASVPEPSTFFLFSIAALAGTLSRRR
jgi:hypothetical protein